MAFMEKQAEHMACWQIETTSGTESVPADLVGDKLSPVESTRFELAPYLEGTPLRDADPEYVEGWFARLSAPGYLDCTDWSGPFASEKEAMEYLEELYGDNQ